MLGADVPMITPNNMNLPAVIYEMACQAATVCSPGNCYYHIFVFMLGIQLSRHYLINMKTK